MSEVKKELQRNIADMEKTVTSLTRGSGKERVTAVEGTDKERRNSPERNIASKATVKKNQSVELGKRRKESGKTVTFSPRCEEEIVVPPAMTKSTELSNRPRVETVRFVIERTLPVAEMEVFEEMMESRFPVTEVDKSSLPRIEMGKEPATEVTERWICPPTTTTRSLPERWISNFLGDQTQAESCFREMTNAERSLREKLGKLDHLNE